MPDPRQLRRHVKFERKSASTAGTAAGNGRAAGSPIWQVGDGSRSRDSGSLKPLFGVLVAIVGMVAVALALNVEKDDPHYVIARDSVREYEYGKTTEMRNYSKPLYQAALDELALVGSDSMSYDPSIALAGEIRLGIDRFEARQGERNRNVSAAATQRQKQRRAIVNEIEHERINPQTDYPECDDEATDGHPDS